MINIKNIEFNIKYQTIFIILIKNMLNNKKNNYMKE